MLGYKNTKKKTALGGAGIAILLCALMVGMTMTNYVPTTAPQVESELAIASEESEDVFALQEVYEPASFEYEETSELEGMRTINQKAFRHDDGKTTLVTTSDPIHYQSDIGSWEEIDLNLKATRNGWEVTENNYQVSFAAEPENGVELMIHQNVDPLITGLNPQVVTFVDSAEMLENYHAAPALNPVEVGGNQLRYSIAEGFDLDYTVTETSVKQDLVIRERPVLEEAIGYFGFTEQMIIPLGFGLYSGDDLVNEELIQTQSSLDIRNLETGELLANIPAPVVEEPESDELTFATYFVKAYGNVVVLTTAVDAAWLMAEDRQFPLAIDPTINVLAGSTGECYMSSWYSYCTTTTNQWHQRYSTYYRYLPYSTYTFTSNNQLPNQAVVDKIEYVKTLSSGYTYSSAKTTVSVMESCGYNSGTRLPSTNSCSGLLTSFSSSSMRISSIWNSAKAGEYTIGAGKKYIDICSSSGTACNTATGSHNYIINAVTNGGSLGMATRYTASTTMRETASTGGSGKPYLAVTYSGGVDNAAPLDGFIPYSGVTSYKEGPRTFFTTLTDLSSIDTTATGSPHLHVALNNQSFTAYKATTIGTCGSTTTECMFRATTPDLSYGDYVEYYWAYQDANSAPNMATNPTGGSGVPATASAPSNPHWFQIEDPANAGTEMKFTVSATDVRTYNSYSTVVTYDRQMTYYENSEEYVFEFDTSACGTGTSSCFYTTRATTSYTNWLVQWTTTPTYSTRGLGFYNSQPDVKQQISDFYDGYLSISADDGPGMNLIFLYDSGTNGFAMVGLGNSTSIEEPLVSGDSATLGTTSSTNQYFRIKLPSNFTGEMAKFDWGGTYSTSRANWMCTTASGVYYFFRSSSSAPSCTSSTYYLFGGRYAWSGFAFSGSGSSVMASTGEMTYKLHKVAPEPDTFAPTVEHASMKDSHSKDRTFSFVISDAGAPPSGLDTTPTKGVGPTFYHRITDANGSIGNWESTLLTSSDTRANCILLACTWSTSLEQLERGSQIEYYVEARDLSTVSTGVNSVTSTTSSFEVGDPNKVFIVEWHDAQIAYSDQNKCTFQVLMYDVTNEIEFKYDSGCLTDRDVSTVGYMDQTRSSGATLRQANGYIYGGRINVFDSNYRISTDSTSHAWESFDIGLTSLPTYDVAIQGYASTSGDPTNSNCGSSSSYSGWSRYSTWCNANVDLPEGFVFDYFGTEYNGSNASDRVHIGRMGNMHLANDGSTAAVQTMSNSYYFYNQMRDLPYSGSTYYKPGLLAPWFSYYTNYYCLDDRDNDCQVRTRMIPFEGKGTDVSADITIPTTWALVDSPIRVNPSSASGYLSIGDDLTIEPGVVIQVAQGKGLSFDGTCSEFTAEGTEEDPILFEGQDEGLWKGLAFTAACGTSTDDRHTLSYVNFANTSDAAIAAGSRHGASPSSTSNVGNFTMDHVTFSNVGTAFKHGSGQGTVLTMTDFEISNARDSCFDLAEDSEVTLRDGEMAGCNTNGNTWGGAVISFPGSTSGSLVVEDVDIDNSSYNLIDTDFATVWISNLSVTGNSGQSGTALTADGSGVGSTLYVNNMDATMYSSVVIYSMDSFELMDVDFGNSASVTIAPGGTQSTGAGPSGLNAVMEDMTSGDVTMSRVAPRMVNVTIGSLSIQGNSPSADGIIGSNWDTNGIAINGCGYRASVDGVVTDYIAGSCSSSASPNNLKFGNVQATYTGTMNAVYARNTAITIGEGTITMPSSYDKMSSASTNGRIVLIDVDQVSSSGTTTNCVNANVCDVYSSSSGVVYFGNLATVNVYELVNGVQVDRPDHTVQASVVDSGSALFTVGSHTTDSNGDASVWVISENDAGDTFTQHNLVAYGPAGQNETTVTDPWYPSGGFGVGDTISLRLEPTPVTLNGTNMDCAYLMTNPEAALGYTGSIASGGTNTFIWQGKVTMTGDLNIDDCNVVMRNVFSVTSDAVNSPTLTISTGGKLVLEKISASTGTLKAASSTYPLNLDIAGGTLELDGGVIKDVDGGIVLDSGIMTVSNSAIIYGRANAPATEVTLHVNGGELDWDDSTIQNSNQIGTGIKLDNSLATIDNIVVKNAAIGIHSYNAAPAVNGFTLTDNDVGLEVYGGMSLPTIYRSTILSGEAQGWTTHEVDLTAFMDDYIQIGANSVYAGGSGHPYSSSYYSKYYMITDRMNIQLTDDSGNSWYVNSTTTDGYYDGALGGASGVPSHHCQQYGYTNNPLGTFYRDNSPQGWAWETTDSSPDSNYPRHYWGYYSPAWSWSSWRFWAPPEGLTGSYNVCLHLGYYNIDTGSSNRLTMPIIDLSGMNNITSVKAHIDVLHNGADNFQDRLEFVARSGDDPSNLGEYQRESGTPNFSQGTISGGDTGVSVGGSFAAAAFDNISVNSASDAGFEIAGSATSTFSDISSSGSPYGILIGNGANGNVDFNNVDIDGSTNAGVYYLKNLKGALSGSITNTTGPAVKYGPATDADLSWTGMSLATNAVGIENGGTGTLTFTDSTFANTKDITIPGSGTVNFVEGTIDSSSVEVTGQGMYNRMRALDVSVKADNNSVSGTNVVLRDSDGVAIGSAVTDANGDAVGMTFVTAKVDSSGLSTMNLNGYELVTVAKVGAYYYNSAGDNAGDFRYAMQGLTLSDAPGNSDSIDLVSKVKYRVCYSSALSSYPSLSNCPGISSSSQTGRTYTSGLQEYGYYGALPTDMSNEVVMFDFGLNYLRAGADYNFNGSTVLVTGSYIYDDAARIWGTSGGTKMYAHNSEWIGLGLNSDGEAQGYQLGYYGRNNLIPDIQNSTLSGVASIASNYGYAPWWNPSASWQADFFNIQNNTITHFRDSPTENGVYYEDICLNTGVQNSEVRNNVFKDCAVGVFFQRTVYSWSVSSTYWGADGSIVEDNTFIDTEYLDVWFYFAYTNDAEVRDNTFSGTSMPGYNVYIQDRSSTGLIVDGNTFSNGEYPIYMRYGTDWTITNNSINGNGDASYPGIGALNGYGRISGNTLTDADGGILIDGIQTGQIVEITDNVITQTPGRTAPSAVGIWAEDCGSSPITTGGNTISTMENALVTDGCDLTDVGSTLTAIGGTGGTVYSVDILANVYDPSSLNISTGDSVRWRSVEYRSGTPHDVTGNDSTWGSNGDMNLGTTYIRTFTVAGTYEYHCSVHPDMTGVITVTNGTGGGFTSTGVNIAGTVDDITLNGTSVSGYTSAVEQYGGSLTLTGDALIAGGQYGAYVEDTDVEIDGASVTAGSTGTAMHVEGASTFDAQGFTSTGGLIGLFIDGVDFRWNGGSSSATTAVMVDNGAEGSVENVTWSDVTTQIDAGAFTTVTSVGNTVDASKLILDTTAVVHEGNLLTLDVTHKGGDATDVGLMIQSTDGAQAAYVSPAYRNAVVNTDGDLDEWFGNVKNPSDDAMPGVMSTDGAGEDFMVTWDATNLYIALTGVDMGAADLQIYIDSTSGGDSMGQSWYVAHTLPFAADFLFWAEDGSDDANYGLKVNGFNGWTDVSCPTVKNSYIGHSMDTDSEIVIPWSCIGSPSSSVRMIGVVQDESTGAVNSVHPDQNIAAGAVGQTFNEEMTVLLGHSDLSTGSDLVNHLLIYRSYIGSNTPTDAKTYNVATKVTASCAEDWGTLSNIDMSTSKEESIDILRACPVIQDLVDITVNEDSGTYTLTLTDKADDVQDIETSLTWSVADDADPSKSPGMLLDSGLNGQTMTIIPDHDQFGEYTFHFEVEDSHGLTDNKVVVFTVLNVNDAPVICNSERADCMPVFADDGAGNLNVLDEGFGSISKVLGSAANATGSYVIDMASNDMANEQPQVYTWGASIKTDGVTVEPYWVQKKFDSVVELFAEAGSAVTANGGFQDIAMTGDPIAWAAANANGSYTLPTLNDVALLTYLLAQNGCGSVWYQEYMDSSGNKVTAVRSDDGCDSTIDANAIVYNSMNYTDFWSVAYGVDVTSFDTTWDEIFPNGYSTTGGYDPCPAYSVSVVNNELTITENQVNEQGGECTIILTLNDDGGYCENAYLGRTTDVKASCVSYTWLVDYDVVHPVYGPMTVTGCYNLYLGLASFVPEYLAPGVPSGITEDICLAYTWVGENTDATPFEVTFAVTPVNDAPEVLDWNRQDGVVIADGNGEVPNFPWKVTLTEDDESLTNLTYDLSAMKHDNDHEDADLTWSIVKSDTCNYENYFSATIEGDNIVFDLIKDATTNAPEWEVDYLNNGGIHQKNPLSGEFCPITLYLHDTETAPAYVPNYFNDYGVNDSNTGNYQQGEDSVTMYIRVDNVAENVPDYFFDTSGATPFDFNGVSNIMPKTMVPTTVTIGHGGDEGPYNYEHMLEVTFYSNGYDSTDPTAEGYVNLGTNYVIPPAYGETLEVTDMVYVTSTTTKVWVEMDVLTCVDENCDMSKSPEDRYFGYAFPEAHACIKSDGTQGAAWSCPGEVGSSSVDEDGNPSPVTLENKRRPMLEDQDWCNNLMTTMGNGSDCAQPRTFGKTTIGTDQPIPVVVRLIGTADVPSFAPSLIAISAAGLFVSALVLQSRRDEEEEILEEMTLEDDEQAVSPVIATILMVAITVVLSGVIYVWASSLADTSAKGVPRMTFNVDSSNAADGADSFHRITVTGSQVELATQAIVVTFEYTDPANGETYNEVYNLADPTVYGFFPGNSPSMVTFGDSVESEGGALKSSLDTGDSIYIRSTNDNGDLLENLYIDISYVPNSGAGSVLRTWTNL